MIEDIIKKWEQEVPTCMDEKGQIYPTMYPKNPSMFCPYLSDYCAYQKEQQREIICTYQTSLSLLQELLK